VKQKKRKKGTGLILRGKQAVAPKITPALSCLAWAVVRQSNPQILT